MVGRKHAFTYDHQGNRKTHSRNSHTTTSTPNNLNQYTARTNHGHLLVEGTSTNATVKVYETGSTEDTATRKNNYYFRDWDPDTTSTASDYPEINIKEGTRVSDTKNAWIPAVSESPTYDANGNLTGDVLWSYTYDEENRLITMTETSAAATAGFPDTTITFKYDYLGRRVEKKVVRGTTTESHLRFVWRGWLLVAELNAASNNALVKTYTWGPDISGSFGGAGGNGGVLIFRDHTRTDNESFFPAYDAQGNVTGLIDTSGNLVAAYEYDPFGKLIRYAGTRSTSMSLLYGTKYLDMETGLIYYGHRYYDPRQGRFINRDPIGEEGGINLYGMVGNNPVNWVDYLGLCDSEGDIDPETDEEICEEDQIRIVIVGRTDNGDLIVVIDGRPEDVDRFRQQARDYVGEDRRSGLVWDGQFSDGTQLGWDGDSLVLRDENSSILSDFGVGESVLVAGHSNTGFDLIYAEVKSGDIEVLGFIDDNDSGSQRAEGNTYIFGFGGTIAAFLGFDGNIDLAVYLGGGLRNWKKWDAGVIASAGGGIGIAGSPDVHFGGLRGSLQDQEGPYRFAQATAVLTLAAIDTNDYSDINRPLFPKIDPTGWTLGWAPGGSPLGVILGEGGAEVWSVQGVIQSVRERIEEAID